MRELVFKNLTSEDKKRRDLFISETIEKNGIKTITQRHSVYIIGNFARINSSEELAEWEKANVKTPKRRHIFIVKARDTKQKKDSFLCDVIGEFYTVVKDRIYPVAFKHSFEIDFVAIKEQ